MGILNFFQKKDYKELLIYELKQDKDRLHNENNELKQVIKQLESLVLNNSNKPKNKLLGKKLSKSELNLLNLYNKHKPQNINEFSKITKIKVTSLYVICNRIKNKGFDIHLKKQV